jgi:hypothetical protein
MSNAAGALKAFIHGFAPECDDELKDLMGAARALDQAELNHSSAGWNWIGGNTTIVASTAAEIACVAAAETVIVPILCLIGGLTGVGAGGFWAIGSAEALEAADGAIEDALEDLKDAEEAFCRCMMNHKP